MLGSSAACSIIGRKFVLQPGGRQRGRPRAGRARLAPGAGPVGDVRGRRAQATLETAKLRPEICTLDCGWVNSGAIGEYIMVNSTGMLRSTARRVREPQVHPNLNLFDTGH